jgi:hypothetical protein
MNEVDIPKIDFFTRDGHYELLMIPFHLCNAYSTFHILMNHIFKPCVHRCVLFFFDDTLVYKKHLGRTCGLGLTTPLSSPVVTQVL